MVYVIILAPTDYPFATYGYIREQVLLFVIHNIS